MTSFKIILNTEKYNSRSKDIKNDLKRTENSICYVLDYLFTKRAQLWRNKLEIVATVVKTYDLNPGREINGRAENQ